MDLYSEELPLEGHSNHTSIEWSPVIDFKTELSTILTHGENQEINPERREHENQVINSESLIKSQISTEELNYEVSNETPTTSSLNESHQTNTEDTSEQIKKKKQPKKVCSSKLSKPTRVSSRNKRPILLCGTNDSSNELSNSNWTTEEKEQLLKGLQEFGIDDIEGIQSLIVTRSPEEIRKYIRRLKFSGERHLEKLLSQRCISQKKKEMLETVSSLIKWEAYYKKLEQSCPQRYFGLSRVFLLISEYGVFPETDDEGIDMRAMYRYLHCMMSGKPYYGLNKKTMIALHEVIDNVLHTLNTMRIPDHLTVKKCIHETLLPPKKTYDRPPKKVFPSSIKQANDSFKLLQLNPLNVPADLLKRKKIILKKEAKKPDEEDMCLLYK